ncbi:MAG: hypothetical protein ACK41U_04415 [Paracoccus sp. (in: a-proteobacteria)]|uniref:hypothetical protein n=1 Tax=Paracoccus sp. TaxID=267 RepID=UPI00391B72C0
MIRAALRHLAAIRAALLAGDAAAAQSGLDALTALLAQGVDQADCDRLEPALADLRALAEASLRGAGQAVDDLRVIVQTAQSLQTYDHAGQRRISATLAPPPHRF